MQPIDVGRVRAAFDRDFVTVPIAAIVPLKSLRQGALESGKYGQILSSIKAIGLVEAPAVIAAPGNDQRYYLLDGHLRIEALKQLGIEEVECLLATEEDTYTYNKRISRLPPVQEHRMIVRAVERGVAPAQIAEALGLEADTIVKRFRLLDGISPDVAELLAMYIERGNNEEPHKKLSDREFEVLVMIGQGKSLTEISDVLFLSVKTVSTYRARILEKMKMTTNAELVRYTLKHELID